MKNIPLHRRLIAGLLPAIAAVLTACGGSTTDPNAAGLRVLNASPDYASLDLYVDGTREIGATASGAVSSGLSLSAGTYTMALRNAGGTTTLTSASRTVAEDTNYVLVAYGSSGALKSSLLSEGEDAPASGSAKLRVLLAAAESGSVDVYLSDSCATVTDFTGASAVVSSLAAGATSSFVTTGSGTLCLRVTGAGDTTDLRLAIPTLTLASQEVSTLVLQPGSGGVLLNGITLRQGASTTAHANTLARVRLVAGVADNATVAATVGSTTLAAGARSPAVGSYALVSAGSPALSILVNGTAVATNALAASAGGDYTLLVTGSAAAPTLAVLSDDNRLAATSTAKLRAVHGASVLSGDNLTLTVDFAALADNIAFATASAYGSVATTSDRSVEVSAASAASALYSNAELTLASQGVYSIFVLANGTGTSAVLRKDR